MQIEKNLKKFVPFISTFQSAWTKASNTLKVDRILGFTVKLSTTTLFYFNNHWCEAIIFFIIFREHYEARLFKIKRLGLP
ncbi:hypothetical protein BpHYR1_026941 [Brachionus plicatilis]|uniref:Uncharacterized protein n=1 Tax=Brachionus plicatilis TaxID=10195 RepID=A0A3M7P9G4_BRAPC|nr:hypothetical protein BpHYR1_026941 [Brachionus plicatilis]